MKDVTYTKVYVGSNHTVLAKLHNADQKFIQYLQSITPKNPATDLEILGGKKWYPVNIQITERGSKNETKKLSRKKAQKADGGAEGKPGKSRERLTA